MSGPPSGPGWIWLLVLANFAYQFWMIRDLLARDDDEIRGGRVGPWLLGIVFGGPMGALMYQLGGRNGVESDPPEGDGINERDDVLRFVLLWAILGGTGIAAVGLFLSLPVIVAVGVFAAAGAWAWRYRVSNSQRD